MFRSNVFTRSDVSEIRHEQYDEIRKLSITLRYRSSNSGNTVEVPMKGCEKQNHQRDELIHPSISDQEDVRTALGDW